jgi:hypothetical protein
MPHSVRRAALISEYSNCTKGLLLSHPGHHHSRRHLIKSMPRRSYRGPMMGNKRVSGISAENDHRHRARRPPLHQGKKGTDRLARYPHLPERRLPSQKKVPTRLEIRWRGTRTRRELGIMDNSFNKDATRCLSVFYVVEREIEIGKYNSRSGQQAHHTRNDHQSSH